MIAVSCDALGWAFIGALLSALLGAAGIGLTIDGWRRVRGLQLFAGIAVVAASVFLFLALAGQIGQCWPT